MDSEIGGINTTVAQIQAQLENASWDVEAAKAGAHIGTMPFKVFEQLFKHPLTDKGLDAFLKDWEKARESLGDIVEAAGARKTVS